jgi:probable rRNA maturation factor
MIDFEVHEDFASKVDASQLERAARQTLAHQLAAPEAGLTIVVTTDEQLQELNFQYRQEDAPTDVLAFPADYTDPDTRIPYLGDVLISYPRAEAQAAAAGHAVAAELQLLAVHGVLHLLGHDHLEPDEKARMWAAQAEILDHLGVSIASLPE